MPVRSLPRDDDVIFVRTVRLLVVSRNLLCAQTTEEKSAGLTPDGAFRAVLEHHLEVVQALWRFCEHAAGSRHGRKKAVRHIEYLRKWLADEGRPRDTHLMEKIRALAHIEDTALLPMAPFLLGTVEWHALEIVVDQLENVIREHSCA